MGRLNKYRLSLILVFLTLVASTILTWWTTRGVVITETDKIFYDQVITIENTIINRFELYKTVLYGLQSFLAQKTVTAEKLGSYTKSLRLEERFPSISAIAYAKRTNDDHYIVTYVYPPERSTAIGFDTGGEERRLTAINKAIDGATIGISDKVLLAADQAPGFVMYAPLYKTDNPPEDSEKRRTAVDALVLITFKSEDIFKNVFRPNDPYPHLDFELYKGNVAADDHLLYDHDAAYYIRRSKNKGGLETEATIFIGDEVFTLLVAAKPSFGLVATEKNLPGIVLAVGLVASVLIFLLFYQKMRSQHFSNQIKT